MRTTIKAYLSLNLGRIPPLTSELVALEGLKKTPYNLVSTLAPSFLFGQWIFILVMTCWLSGERSLPFGLLVFQNIKVGGGKKIKIKITKKIFFI